MFRAAADLNVVGMPTRHVYAIGRDAPTVCKELLRVAASIIDEHFQQDANKEVSRE